MGWGSQQYRIERTLAGWASELGTKTHLGCEVTGFTQDDSGVDVKLSDGATLRTQYLVGCDGGRSIIRKTAGIEFPGWDPSTSCLVADVEMDEQPPWGMHRAGGFHSFFKLDDEGSVQVMVAEPRVGNNGEPTLHDLREALIAARGTDCGIRSATWISRFTDVTRQAASYRERRVLLAGDAAHVHFPIGGQGLNTGVAYGAKYPMAVAKITDDLDRLLAFYDFPAEHWVHLRTTNPIEFYLHENKS
jgi:2-polyprenyl-6-methoxyphenol hydroxylase-like FAD-dependent oxidoreductase